MVLHSISDSHTGMVSVALIFFILYFNLSSEICRTNYQGVLNKFVHLYFYNVGLHVSWYLK